MAVLSKFCPAASILQISLSILLDIWERALSPGVEVIITKWLEDNSLAPAANGRQQAIFGAGDEHDERARGRLFKGFED